MKKTGIIVGLIVLLGLGGIAGGYYYFVQRPNITVGDDGIIFIQPGDSFETVMTTLISSGYVKNEYTLRKLAELKKYPSAVKTGRYRLVDKMNNNQLINMLRAGRQEPVHLTFNNIRTLEDFAAILSRQLGIDSTEFLQLARNAEYVKKLSFTPENFIGMFIPNTYQVYWRRRKSDDYPIRRAFRGTDRADQNGLSGFTYPLDHQDLSRQYQKIETYRPE